MVRIQEVKLTIKASKCQVGQSSVVYLAHKVGNWQVFPLDAKVESVLGWEVHTTHTEVRAFLGLTGYYRSFVANGRSIVTPLTALTSRKPLRKVNWTEECQRAFVQLKKALWKCTCTGSN